MNILARTGKARWCSKCGKSWQHHFGIGVINYQTGQRLGRCPGADWTTRGPAKRIRRARDMRNFLFRFIAAAKGRP